MTTQEQLDALTRIVDTLEDIVKDCQRIPSGHLYAALMGHGVTLDKYQTLVSLVVARGNVTLTSGHELIWTGGEKCS